MRYYEYFWIVESSTLAGFCYVIGTKATQFTFVVEREPSWFSVEFQILATIGLNDCYYAVRQEPGNWEFIQHAMFLMGADSVVPYCVLSLFTKKIHPI